MRSLSVEVREEQPQDFVAIREVNRLAFGQQQEANIVDALRSSGAVLLSLVAVLEGQVVGHILYSPVSLGPITGAGLGPMAVLPQFQRHGIGSQLIDSGNRKLREARCPFVVVVGHPDYYPRFGFRPASAHEITCQWEVPDEVFMLLVLDQSTMNGVTGLAKYREEFSSMA